MPQKKKDVKKDVKKVVKNVIKNSKQQPLLKNSININIDLDDNSLQMATNLTHDDDRLEITNQFSSRNLIDTNLVNIIFIIIVLYKLLF